MSLYDLNLGRRLVEAKMLALFWKLLAWRFTRPVGLEGQLYSSQMSPVIFQFSSLKERDRGEERMREKEEERDFICCSLCKGLPRCPSGADARELKRGLACRWQ